MYIILVLFYIFSPVGILYLCKRFPFFDKFGAVAIAYILGMIIGNLGILDETAKPLQDSLSGILVALSLPLILFSVNLKQWSRLSGRTALSMLLGIIAIVTSIVIGFYIFREQIPESWKVAGLLTGVYLGATFNMAAIQKAIGASSEVYGVVNALDIVVCMFYFFFLITIAQRLFNKFLPKFQKEGNTGSKFQTDENLDNWDAYIGIFQKQTIYPLLVAVFLSVAIAASAFAISIIITSLNAAAKQYSDAIVIIAITSLSILISTIPKINRIKKTFQSGMYLILVFCVVVGSMANMALFANTSVYLLWYVILVIFGSLFLHFLLAWIFKIDTDTVIITSSAMIFSPPFVPSIANALHNREIILSGLTVGIVGYTIGNYIGIALAYLLR